MKRSSTLVHLAFLALFPGFFFYQSALGEGDIAAILKGYFSPVALAFVPVLAILYLLRVRDSKRFLAKTDLAFFGFLLYFLCVVAINFSIGSPAELVASHLTAIIHFFVVFLIFRMAQFDSRQLKWPAVLSLLGMTALIFYLSVNGFFYLRAEGLSNDLESVATYQGFARSYFLTFLVVAPFIRMASLRLLVYTACIPAMFLNGARSELVALVMSAGLIEGAYAKRRPAVLALALIPLVVLGARLDDFIALLPDNRSLELLHFSESSSWEDRSVLFDHALRTIGEHPLLGDYGGYYSLLGPGSYAHNIFSAWVDLGLFGFVYLLCMLLFPMYFLVADAVLGRRKGKTEEWVLAFCLVSVALLLLFTTKNFTYMLTAAALGSYSNYRSARIAVPEDARASVRPVPTAWPANAAEVPAPIGRFGRLRRIP